ncbi:hypothetical protein [Sinomonas atrocyanea]
MDAVQVLSENGRHFLRSTLEEIHKDSPTSNRNAVIYVAAALEVLLKTRLAIEHWTLLFDDPAKAKIAELKSGDFISVQASKLVSRLNNILALDLKPEASDKIFRLRNRVVHYAPPSGLALRVEVALGMNFALQFIHDHLLPLLDSEEHAELRTLKEEISKVFLDLDEFRTKRLLTLEGELRTHSTIVECPDCSQHTLVITGDGNGGVCLFCLTETEGEELAQRYKVNVLQWGWRDEARGSDNPIHECFECGALSLVAGIRVINRPKIAYGCFSCGEVFDDAAVDLCDRCGALKVADDEDTLCPDCWSSILPSGQS